MRTVVRALAEAVFLLLGAPLLLAFELASLWLTDFVALFSGRKETPPSPALADDPARTPVSIVIPTWNGKHHLEANLPSVVAAIADRPGSEILIVENASDDGSAEFVGEQFPSVKVLQQTENLGFGAGSNAGFQAATNAIVVLLNNDMRVEPNFLTPLVEGFRGPDVFAVSAQIFFSDPEKRREETGLTTGLWEQGRLQLGHVEDETVDELFPTFYAGGGSSAYDRERFLELGGFDPILHPFYVEDADVSYGAWKRGWKILYAPGSVVYHEHRGTIGKKFNARFIERTVQKNNLLFVWKNIHEPRRLAAHFLWTWAALWTRLIAGPSPTRPDSATLLKAVSQTLGACRARLRARRLATVSDTEALKRPWPGYYRDRFLELKPITGEKDLNVVFFSPYGLEPPIHGGAVFMNQTVRHLAKLCRLHLFCLLDFEDEEEANQSISELCASATYHVRDHARAKTPDAWRPYAAQHFWDPAVLWKLHSTIYRQRADVVQIEYTQLGVYALDFERIATCLFEHDVYFQSVGRGMEGVQSWTLRVKYLFEYLRALRFERRALKRFDSVHVCTAVNKRYLESFAWDAPPIHDGFRAGIDVGRYAFADQQREPDTVLFVGNFRHPPNQSALEFLVREVWPEVRAKRPRARLIAVGAQAPKGFEEHVAAPGVEFLGEVEDIREPLDRYAVLAAPILTGSGVRVKLLEAFAAGIPVVATSLGAEGLTEGDTEVVRLADDAASFSARLTELLEEPEEARALARRARREVERAWDMATITGRLAGHYREMAAEKRGRL